MSLRVTYELLCDFCGIGLHEKEVMVIGPNPVPVVIPSQAEQLRLPRWFWSSHVRLNGVDVHLCRECYGPVGAAFQKRLDDLRASGKLVGYPQA